MNKAFEKILERLQERRKLHSDLSVSDKLSVEEQEVQSRLCGCFSKAKQIVQEVASEYNNGWIPCSEKLPEEAKTTGYVEEDYVDGKLTEYIVMILGAKKPTTLYYAGDGHWYDVASQEYYPVIAWQPLPEPYEDN